jgi:hypothetical protein
MTAGGERFDTVTVASHHYPGAGWLAESVEAQLTFEEDGAVVQESAATILVESLGDIQPSACFLSSFGFPEPQFDRPAKHRWFWFLSLGILLVAVGTLIRHRRKLTGKN